MGDQWQTSPVSDHCQRQGRPAGRERLSRGWGGTRRVGANRAAYFRHRAGTTQPGQHLAGPGGGAAAPLDPLHSRIGGAFTTVPPAAASAALRTLRPGGSASPASGQRRDGGRGTRRTRTRAGGDAGGVVHGHPTSARDNAKWQRPGHLPHAGVTRARNRPPAYAPIDFGSGDDGSRRRCAACWSPAPTVRPCAPSGTIGHAGIVAGVWESAGQLQPSRLCSALFRHRHRIHRRVHHTGCPYPPRFHFQRRAGIGDAPPDTVPVR